MPKPGKSSKTARVLNLLTDPESVETAAPPADDNSKLADDRRTQAKIRGALEQELADSAASARLAAPRAPEMPKPAPSVISAIPAVIPDFSSDAQDSPEPTFSVPPQPQSPLQTHMEKLRNACEKEPDEYICFNVTQALVEDKADKYIKMFGLCGCNRCRIDVIALALSNLPAKYVVAKPHELIPRLSMYEQKYNAAVVTQVMGACRKVLDRPHHEREEK